MSEEDTKHWRAKDLNELGGAVQRDLLPPFHAAVAELMLTFDAGFSDGRRAMVGEALLMQFTEVLLRHWGAVSAKSCPVHHEHYDEIAEQYLLNLPHWLGAARAEDGTPDRDEELGHGVFTVRIAGEVLRLGRAMEAAIARVTERAGQITGAGPKALERVSAGAALGMYAALGSYLKPRFVGLGDDAELKRWAVGVLAALGVPDEDYEVVMTEPPAF
jgi:hypothetical protein